MWGRGALETLGRNNWERIEVNALEEADVWSIDDPVGPHPPANCVLGSAAVSWRTPIVPDDSRRASNVVDVHGIMSHSHIIKKGIMLILHSSCK